MKYMMRLMTIVVLSSVAFFGFAGSAHAATNGRMIDDAVFDDSGSMTANDIQTFLNGFPNSCIKTYNDDMPVANPLRAYFDYSGTGSAAQIIRRVADNWGINPRVLLAKLEQESSLVSGSGGCDTWRFRSAIGFNCPGPIYTHIINGVSVQTCVVNPANVGFSRQLSKGGWLLKWGKERARGNLEWLVADDGASLYSGPMTQGTWKRSRASSPIYFDGYWNGIYVETAATASLYNYTPFLNQAFDNIWEGWWGAGSTVTANYSYQTVTQWADKDLMNMPAGEAFTYYLQVKNTGNRTWTKTGPNPIRLGTTGPTDRISSFCDATWISCYRPGMMVEDSVPSGGIANFVIVMRAPTRLGYQTQSFSLVAENLTWMQLPGVLWESTIVQPQLTSQFVATTIPTTMTAGATSSVTLTLKNTTNNTWYSNEGFQVRLATSGPHDRVSPFEAPSWLAPSRLVGLSTNVAPGANAVFTFNIKAPAYNGTYVENYQLVMEGYTWFPGADIQRTITVTGGSAQPKIPVYRLYNGTTRVHFYTADATELALVQQRYGYTLDGVAFYAYQQPSGGGQPVYRLYNPSTGIHFYTADPAELALVQQRYGFTLDGVAFYEPLATGTGDKPVYRLYNGATRVHFYTADPVELGIVQQRYGFTLDGVAFNSVP